LKLFSIIKEYTTLDKIFGIGLLSFLKERKLGSILIKGKLDFSSMGFHLTGKTSKIRENTTKIIKTPE
jgi:hypothetical protein